MTTAPIKNSETHARRTRNPVSIFDPRAVINPGTLVVLSRSDKATPHWKHVTGRKFMVGFYSKSDGLDCVWLVNEAGEYEQTVDRGFLFRYFTIAKPSGVTDWYGARTKLPAWPKKGTPRA
jgi:hypothetical protein